MRSLRFAPFLLGGLALPLLLSCGGDGGTDPVNQTPASVVKVLGEGQSTRVGTAVPEDPTVEVRNMDGNPLPGISVEFEVVTGAGEVSPDSAVTGSDGRASARWTLGTSTSVSHSLRARAGNVSTTFTAEPEPGSPVGLEKISGDDQRGNPGSILPDPLVVEVTDEFGNGVPGVTVQFSVSAGSVDPAEAATDENGRARTTVTLPDDETTISVSAAGPGLGGVEFSVIAEIDPVSVDTRTLDRARETLEYEASLEATGGSGSGFVWELADGQLPPGIELAEEGLLTGVPTDRGSFDFTVRVSDDGGKTATRALELTVCEAPVELAPGEARTQVPPPGEECGIFLPSGDRGDYYRVTVLWPNGEVTASTAPVSLATTAFGTSGNRPQAATLRAPSPSRDLRDLPGIDARTLDRALRWQEATQLRHAEIRRQEEALLGRVGGGALLREGSPPSGDRFRAGARASAPETLRLDLDRDNLNCTRPREERTVQLLVEDERVAIYQDSAQRTTNPVDTALTRKMLDYYRDHGEEVIEAYFDGVTDINDDGIVNVVITPEIGDNVAAFVWAGDFFDQENCPTSNEMELVYYSADVINAMDRGVYQALRTLAHEIKHVSSLYHRLVAGDFHPIWVEEGTADLAGNLSARLAWSENGGPQPQARVVGGSFGGSDGIDEYNWGLILQLARAVWYLSSQPNALTEQPSGASQFFDIRGPGWTFHRWLGDAYFGGALADSAFFREQNDSSSASGLAFIEQRVGKSFEALLEEYARAVSVNGWTDVEEGTERIFTGWNLRSSAEIFCAPNPVGEFPWPVTIEGTRSQGDCADGGFGEEEFDLAAPFATDSYSGRIGAGGFRIHDFVSDGTGQGIEINVDASMSPQGRVMVVRLR